MMKSKIKLRLFSLFLALLCICSVFGGAITPVYADNTTNPSWLPDGYKIYKSEPLEDGKTKYYIVPESYGFHEYDEAGKSFSFSPQMTYALYGVEGDSLIEDESDLMKTIADYYDVSIDELVESMIYDYMWKFFDTSTALSNSFAYNGVPDEDSFCFTTFDNIDMDNWFSYAEYWVYDLAGVNDWYVSLQNMFGWHNVYNSSAFNNYKNDKLTFSLYNDDDGDLFQAGTSHNLTSQAVQNRWYDGNIAVSGYNVVKFQSFYTSLVSSGMLIFDNVKVSTGAKTKLSDLFTSLADGNWLDLLEYNDYKKIHTGETDSISLNHIKSPVDNITINDNNLVVDIRDNFGLKIGYYVDYLVYDSRNGSGQKYHLYRHYFYPETVGSQLILNGNSLETKLPFTNCSLDGTQDNTLIKGIGFFGYALHTARSDGKTVAEFAPSKTAGMGDIKYISSYDYYCFDYPFKDNENTKYGYDFDIEIPDYDCQVYIVDDDEIVDQTIEEITYKHVFADTIVSDGGTYIVNNVTYNIDGNYIQTQINNLKDISEEDKKVIFSESKINKCCDACTCTIENHCKNFTYIDGVLTCICAPNDITCDCYKSNNNNSNNSQTDDNYWKQWREWVESCKEFIGGVPELFAYVYSWFPKPLVDFITLSIATGFGIAVIKVVLRRE